MKIRKHKELILDWFKARKAGISLGAVEGLNNKAKVTTKKAYGFRTDVWLRFPCTGTTHLENYLNLNSPIDSGDETLLFIR